MCSLTDAGEVASVASSSGSASPRGLDYTPPPPPVLTVLAWVPGWTMVAVFLLVSPPSFIPSFLHAFIPSLSH